MSAIPNYFVQAWDNAIRVECSQKDSRLMSSVIDRGAITGESFTINGLADDGRLLAQNTQRYGDTEWSMEAQHTRVCNMGDFFEADPLDRADVPKMLVNPVTGGQYMGLLIARRNRRIDDLIYRAARGSQLTKSGSVIALPASQKIASGGTPFTKAKLLATRKLFRRNEADSHAGEELTILYNDDMLTSVLSDTTLTSADFLAVQMLQEGDISKRWMGFNWRPYQGLETIGGVTATIAWAKSGIHFGKGYEHGDVSVRNDKKNAWQVSLEASFGAGRQDEKKIVEISFVAE